MDKSSEGFKSAASQSVPGQAGFDYLIVGAGFAGSVLAERLARGLGLRVLIVDKRPHIGGNAYDRYDDAGILIHPYGPHIFHTNSADIFEYLSRFTKWRPYQHRVLASVDGQNVPMSTSSTASTSRLSRWSNGSNPWPRRRRRSARRKM